jgi:hypothetical protein
VIVGPALAEPLIAAIGPGRLVPFYQAFLASWRRRGRG